MKQRFIDRIRPVEDGVPIEWERDGEKFNFIVKPISRANKPGMRRAVQDLIRLDMASVDEDLRDKPVSDAEFMDFCRRYEKTPGDIQRPASVYALRELEANFMQNGNMVIAYTLHGEDGELLWQNEGERAEIVEWVYEQGGGLLSLIFDAQKKMKSINAEIPEMKP